MRTVPIAKNSESSLYDRHPAETCRATPETAVGSRRTVLRAIVLLLVGLSYVAILNTPLVADDYYVLSDAVAQNPWRFFVNSVFPEELHTEFLRPLTALTFAPDHHLSGYRPVWPHLVNILFHLATTALVGLLVILPADRTKPAPSALLPPVAAMLLFGLHPQAAEAGRWDKAGQLAGSTLDQIVSLVPNPEPNATMLVRAPFEVFGLDLKVALTARYGRSDLHIDQYPKQHVFENPPPNAYALKFDSQQQRMVLTHSPNDTGTPRA